MDETKKKNAKKINEIKRKEANKRTWSEALLKGKVISYDTVILATDVAAAS